MDIRELKGLCEAYEQVYNISEEVEIATEYFYSEGLNEYGIDILVEELGVEEFAEFIKDIAEEYTLTEARAGGARIEPVTKGGKSIGSLKGGAKTSAINRLRKEKAARKEAEAKSSASKQSGMTAALRSQAVKSAAAKQPAAKASKQGIGARIGAALKYAGERAKADTAKVARAAGTAAGVAHGAAKIAHRAGQEFGKSKAGQNLKSGLAKTAKAAAGAAGAGAGSLAAGKSPAAAAGRAAGTFVRKLTKEDCEYIIEYLVDEKYAKDLESANNILESMSEVWVDEIMEGRDEDAQERRFQKHGDRSRGETATRLIGKAVRASDTLHGRQKKTRPDHPKHQELGRRKEALAKRVEKLQQARKSDTSTFRQGPVGK